MLKTLMSAAFALALTCGAASAATVANNTPFDSGNSLTLLGKGQQSAMGSVPGVRISPFDSSLSNMDTNKYYLVNPSGKLSFIPDAPSRVLRVYWGSADASNKILFRTSAGNEVIRPGKTAGVSAEGNASQFFEFVTKNPFTKVIFNTQDKPFEFALPSNPTMSNEVPEIDIFAGFAALAALGGMMMLARERSRKA